MTIAGKIIAFIFGNPAKSLWDAQPEEIKDSFIKGSKIIDILNRNLNKTPEEVLAIITEEFHDLTQSELIKGLDVICDVLDIYYAPMVLLSTIGDIQSYLSTKKGVVLNAILSTIAKVLAFTLSKNSGKKWEIFEELMEFVYTKFIKKR